MAAPRYLATGTVGSTEVAAIETTTGSAQAEKIIATGADGLIDASFLTKAPGTVSLQATASEAITAGALVNVYSNSGAAAAQNADGSVAGTKNCNGYAPAAIASGATGTIIVSNGVITGLTGLTAGTAYLSETSKGAVQAAGSTTAGHTFQRIGTALTTTTLYFDPDPGIVRA